jgi:hypothetical protein
MVPESTAAKPLSIAQNDPLNQLAIGNDAEGCSIELFIRISHAIGRKVCCINGPMAKERRVIVEAIIPTNLYELKVSIQNLTRK